MEAVTEEVSLLLKRKLMYFIFTSSFYFVGPASIGLLSPGTLEYLLESLVSKH